jgi:hypothetical protein
MTLLYQQQQQEVLTSQLPNPLHLRLMHCVARLL